MSDRHELTERNPATQSEEVTPLLSTRELALEGGELLPDKEVLSVLDLFVNLDLALDLAAPIDLAIAANANVAAPIDAAASANVLSIGSSSAALAQQGVLIDQHISGEAIAYAPQDASLDQSNDVVDPGGTGGTASDSGGTGDGGSSETVQPTAEPGADVGGGGGGATIQQVDDTSAEGLLDGGLLNVEVDASIDADLAAPVAGAVAANANVAAPIDAAVSANIGTVNSESTAIADQTAIINQDLEDVTASATADQQADITQ